MKTGDQMQDEPFAGMDFDVDIMCEYYSRIERQGPGNDEQTLKALSFIEPIGESSRILDIGCGTGGQTLTLAHHCAGSIDALDIFPYFIDRLNERIAGAGLTDRVRGVIGSMDALPYERETLDLIWSEGAVYNMGFQRGIREWGKLLKDGGFIAVSEISWFTTDRPAELSDFWEHEYPEIDTIANKVAQMQQEGYVPVATFTLPDDCWTAGYFDPQGPVQEEFLLRYRGNETVERWILEQRHEEDLFRRFSKYYGYAFYIGRKGM